MTFQLDRRPLYAQTYDWLLDLIREEQLQPGDQLPSETLLSNRLGISRATLREALRILEEEGVITRRHGIGTFVTKNHHLESGLERLESILSMAARQGIETQVQDLCAEIIEADGPLAEGLQVERGTPVTQVCRTILVEGQPAAYMEDFVPGCWLTPEDLNHTFGGSVLDLLRQRHPTRVQEALADITAVRAGRPLARKLGVHPGTALLLLEETLFDESGTPLGFSRNYFVPERFRFHVVRR
jgi:GntR family transcriptional regulator